MIASYMNAYVQTGLQEHEAIVGVELNPKFGSEKAMEINLEQKENSLVECKDCSLYFKSNKGLQQHIGKIHHKRKKRARCKLCDKLFKNKYAVRFHVSQVHQKSTKVECEYCGKMIYNKYQLVIHVEGKHPEKKN